MTQPKQTINTFRGVAKYIRTEFEDLNGKWNDNYYISDGYFVIHDGLLHHVYKVGGALQ